MDNNFENFSLGIVNMDGKMYVKQNDEAWKEVDEATYNKLNSVVGNMFGSIPVQIDKKDYAAKNEPNYYTNEFADINHNFVDTMSYLNVYTTNTEIIPTIYYHPGDYVKTFNITIPNPYVYVKNGNSEKVLFLSLASLTTVFDLSALKKGKLREYTTAALGTDDMNVYIYDIYHNTWNKLKYIYYVSNPFGGSTYMLYVDNFEYTIYSKHSSPYIPNNITPYHIKNAPQCMMNIHSNYEF